jgi:hypothetical protein
MCPANKMSPWTTQNKYLDRYSKGSRGRGWYSFDQKGIHLGMGKLGADQLEWLEDDLRGKSNSILGRPQGLPHHIGCGHPG